MQTFDSSTAPSRQNVVVFEAHLPEKLALARKLLAKGFKLLLHTEQLTDELRELALKPRVQLRMCDPATMAHMAFAVL